MAIKRGRGGDIRGGGSKTRRVSDAWRRRNETKKLTMGDDERQDRQTLAIGLSQECISGSYHIIADKEKKVLGSYMVGAYVQGKGCKLVRTVGLDWLTLRRVVATENTV